LTASQKNSIKIKKEMMIHIPLFLSQVYHFEKIVVTPLKLPVQQLLASMFPKSGASRRERCTYQNAQTPELWILATVL
jgi:hypothetical protein